MNAHTIRHARAFTLVEALAAAILLVLLLAVLFPMAHRARLADGLEQSIANVTKIVQATQVYHFDHAGQVPMRGCGYSNGQITGGWDTWNYGGKNCSSFWQTYSGGTWDESAYGRFLNPYLYPAKIERPPGYVNTGSGLVWTFNDGNPTSQQRAALEISVFKSPGDVSTRQRNWPTSTPGVSAYDDVGTSYLVNMKWWDAPGLPPSFSQRFSEGTRRIGLAFAGANPNFVFVNDQTADVVAGGNIQIPGEFGTMNASVMGFADGRVAYLPVSPGLFSGPGYTFIP
jgi:competence protein ComGC